MSRPTSPDLITSAMVRVLSLRDGRGLGPRWSRAGPAEADPARAGELADAVRAYELLEGVELLGPADDLERERIAPDVGDPGAEDLAEGDQLGALVGRRPDRDQRQ